MTEDLSFKFDHQDVQIAMEDKLPKHISMYNVAPDGWNFDMVLDHLEKNLLKTFGYTCVLTNVHTNQAYFYADIDTLECCYG